MIGIKKGIEYGELKEWKYSPIVDGINLAKKENESRINLVAIYNNGKIKEAVKGLNCIVEGGHLPREGGLTY